jgi:hypothetical protein
MAATRSPALMPAFSAAEPGMTVATTGSVP